MPQSTPEGMQEIESLIEAATTTAQNHAVALRRLRSRWRELSENMAAEPVPVVFRAPVTMPPRKPPAIPVCISPPCSVAAVDIDESRIPTREQILRSFIEAGIVEGEPWQSS